MPNGSHCLIVSDDDDFREELIERAVGLNFSVRAIRADELPPMLQGHAFDWLILDLGLGESRCLQVVDALRASPVPPRMILIAATDQAVVAAVRLNANRNGLMVGGVLSRPLSSVALENLLVGKDVDLAELDSIFRRIDAIPNGEIVVHYQPMISMADRTIRRVEALVRWRHPRHGLLTPARFIGLAERSGAIAPLTWEVLRRAIKQHVAWRTEGLLLSVSVNISALLLSSQQTADDILALLQKRDCDPRHLILEITETEATSDPSIARALLTRLREAGVEISMDDYGVGFSNLERLRDFPFSEVKVDRRLVAELDSGHEARRTVEMLVSLAAKEKLSLTGEGIETEEQWNMLEKLGCDFGQGFLIARPMRGDQIEGWIGKMTQIGRYRLVA